jgi:hypothetical protein
MFTTLRAQAAHFLTLAIAAQDNGRLGDAHSLTLKAIEFLEDAISLEELQRRFTLRD